jgi:hypothetical protein
MIQLLLSTFKKVKNTMEPMAPAREVRLPRASAGASLAQLEIKLRKPLP